MRWTTFLRAETGMVTIDWTVIAAALVALGLATGSLVRSGLASLAESAVAQMAGPVLLRGFDTLVAFEDFENSAAGWVGGARDASSRGFGGLLGRFGGSGGEEAVRRRFSLDASRAYAVIEFDLHAIDDWALEEWRVFTDGAFLAARSFATDPALAPGQAERHSGGPGPSVRFSELPGSGQDRGFGAAGDQSYRVRIIAEDPGDTLTLGFGATLEQGIAEASWGIDNLRVLSTDHPQG